MTYLLLASRCTLAADSYLGLQLLQFLGIHSVLTSSAARGESKDNEMQ